MKVCDFDDVPLEEIITHPFSVVFGKNVCLYPVKLNSANLTTDKAKVRFIENYPQGYEEIKDSVTALVVFNSSYDVLNKTADPIVQNILTYEPTCLQLDYESVFLALPVVIDEEKCLRIICRGTIQTDTKFKRHYSGILNPCLYMTLQRMQYTNNGYGEDWDLIPVNIYFHTKTLQDEESKYVNVCTLEEPVLDNILGIEVEGEMLMSPSLYGGYVVIKDSIEPFYFISRLHMFPDPYAIFTNTEYQEDCKSQYIDREEGLCLQCWTVAVSNEMNFVTYFEIYSPNGIGKNITKFKDDIQSFSTSSNTGNPLDISFRFPNQNISSPSLEKIDVRKYKYSFIYYDSRTTPNRQLKTYEYTVGTYENDFLITCEEDTVGITPDIVVGHSLLGTTYGWDNETVNATLPERTCLLARTGGKDFTAVVSGSRSGQLVEEYTDCPIISDPPHTYPIKSKHQTTTLFNSNTSFYFDDSLIAESIISTRLFSHSTWQCSAYHPGGRLLTYQYYESSEDMTFVYFLYTDLSTGSFIILEEHKTYQHSNTGEPIPATPWVFYYPRKYVDITWDCKIYFWNNEIKLLLDEYSRTEPHWVDSYFVDGQFLTHNLDTYYYPHLFLNPYINEYGNSTYQGYSECWRSSYIGHNPGIGPDHSSGYKCTTYLVPWPTASLFYPAYSADDGVVINFRTFSYKHDGEGNIFHIHAPRLNPTMNDPDGDFIDVFIVNGEVIQAQDVYDNCAIPAGTFLR